MLPFRLTRFKALILIILFSLLAVACIGGYESDATSERSSRLSSSRASSSDSSAHGAPSTSGAHGAPSTSDAHGSPSTSDAHGVPAPTTVTVMSDKGDGKRRPSRWISIPAI